MYKRRLNIVVNFSPTEEALTAAKRLGYRYYTFLCLKKFLFYFFKTPFTLKPGMATITLSYIYIYIYIYTGWRKKKLTCLIYFNLKTKRAIRPKLRALHSVLFNLNFDIRPVQFRAILTERAAFKLE